MPDITTVSTAISIVSSIKDLLGPLVSIVKEKQDKEAMEQMLNLQSLLFDLQSRILDLDRERFEAVDNLRVLREMIEHRKKLVRRPSYYEFEDIVEGYGKGPFCLRCTDDENRPIGVPVDSSGHFKCSKCQGEGWLDGMEEAYREKKRSRIKNRLKALSDEEKKILRPYIADQTRVSSLIFFDGNVQGLIKSGIITSTKIVYQNSPVPHEITEDAWEVLNNNRELLE